MPIPADEPLTKQNVVAAVVESLHSVGQELDAWRRFGADVSAFLVARDLAEAFGEFQEKRKPASGKPTKRKR
jgi:hypothetical protein